MSVGLAGLTCVPLLLSAWVRGWWAPDEPRYAEVARELWEGGGFLVLRLCGELYPDKPPLLYWLAALAGHLSGWSEAWMRLPSFVATAASAWLAGSLTARLAGARAARWAPAVYLSFALVAEIGGRLQIDPLMAALALGAVVVAPDGRGSPRARRGRALAAGLLAGLAALAKGPPAWLPIAFGLVALRLARPAREDGEQQPARLGAATWLCALLLAVGPVLAWALAASALEPALREELFFRQHAGRAVSGDAPHAGPFYKHALRLPLLTLPWTTLVLAGLARALARGRSLCRAEPALLFALLWFGALFAFFSAIPPKRDLYLLPAYPALALIAALELARREEHGRLPAWIARPVPLLAAAAGFALLASPLVLPRLSERFGEGVDGLDGLAWRLPLLGLAPLSGGAWALWEGARGRIARWALALLLTTAASWSAAALLVYPAVDPLKSARVLATELALRPERPESIPCVGVRPEGYRFYGARHGLAPTVEGGLEQALERPGDFLALVRESDLERLAPKTRARLVELERRRVGSRVVLVMGRR